MTTKLFKASTCRASGENTTNIPLAINHWIKISKAVKGHEANPRLLPLTLMHQCQECSTYTEIHSRNYDQSTSTEDKNRGSSVKKEHYG